MFARYLNPQCSKRSVLIKPSGFREFLKGTFGADLDRGGFPRKFVCGFLKLEQLEKHVWLITKEEFFLKKNIELLFKI